MTPEAQTPDQQEPSLTTEGERVRAATASIQPVLIGFVLAAIIGAITLATFWGN
jgi:hypothetical protein